MRHWFERLRERVGEVLRPARRRACIDRVSTTFAVSERFTCRALGQNHWKQRKVPLGRSAEDVMTADIVGLASQYQRDGYRRIAAFLREAGWAVNVERIERIWRKGAEGAAEAVKERSALAERRVMHPLAPQAPEPGLVLRFRREPDA